MRSFDFAYHYPRRRTLYAVREDEAPSRPPVNPRVPCVAPECGVCSLGSALVFSLVVLLCVCKIGC